MAPLKRQRPPSSLRAWWESKILLRAEGSDASSVRTEEGPDLIVITDPSLDRANEPFSAIRHPQIAKWFRHWDTLRADRRMPLRSDLDPVGMKGLLANISLVDVLREPLDFRFRLQGEELTLQVGPRRGLVLSEVPAERGRDSMRRRYETCVEERRPVLGRYAYSSLGGCRRAWEALTCPLAGIDEEIVVLATVAVDAGPV